MVRKDLKDLDHVPPSAAKVARLFALQFKRSAAERTERQMLKEARRAGLLDLTDYPATIDGPCVSLFSD